SHPRPYARTRRSSSSPHGGAPRLADLAGRAPAPAVDALEPRQLLCSLTITPDLIDPFTGVGQATVYFGYVLPFLVPLEGDITEIEEPPDPIFERFDDVLNEDLPPLGSPRVNVPSGTIMPDSNLRFTHNIQPATDFQFREEAGSEDEGRLFVRLDQTERFTMQVTLSEETTTQFLGLQRFEFEVQPSQGSIQGLNLNNTRLTLRFLGQVVATFTGTALGQLNTSSPGTGVGRFEIILPNPGAPGEFLSFDEIEISAIAGPNDAFFIDNVGWDIPGQGVAFTGFSSQQFIDNRIFGARLAIAGPVGASVEVLDLYGRDMRPTIML